MSVVVMITHLWQSVQGRINLNAWECINSYYLITSNMKYIHMHQCTGCDKERCSNTTNATVTGNLKHLLVLALALAVSGHLLFSELSSSEQI